MEKEQLERIERGRGVLDRTRDAIRKSRIDCVRPDYIIMSLADKHNLEDYLYHKEKLSTITDIGTLRVLGLTIITDERSILHLPPQELIKE